MKNILILLVLAQIASAQIPLPSSWPSDSGDSIPLGGLDMPVSGGELAFGSDAPKYRLAITPDCIPYEAFTPWVTTADGSSQSLSHHCRWVYADKSEVNPRKDPRYTLAIGCLSPCGCGETEIEARICSECFRHEIRQRSWGFSEKPAVESEYTKLKNKTKE